MKGDCCNMREKHRHFIMEYIINNRDNLLKEVEQLQHNLRLRSVDPVDCLEFMLAKERLNAFDVFGKHILSLLEISDNNFDEYLRFVKLDYKLLEKCRNLNKNKDGEK